jgi:hypothetical protein
MGQDDRDKKFERALMRHLRGADATRGAEPAGVGGAEAGCPDAEMLAAFHERMLTNEEMNAAREHVAGCSRCQGILTLLESTDDVVAAMDGLQDVAHPRASILSTGALYVRYVGGARTDAVTAAASPVNAQQSPVEISGGRGFRAWRWMAPAGAIAAGLFIWVVAREPKYHPSSPTSGNLQVSQERAENDRLTTAYSAPSPTIAPAPAPGPSSSGRSAQPAEEKQKREGSLSDQLTTRNIPLNGRGTSGLARLAPPTSGGTAPSSAGTTSRTANASGAPARPSGSLMGKAAVASAPAPALSKPHVSEPDVRKDDRVAARADRRIPDGNEAGNGNAANASTAGQAKLDQPARQEAGASIPALGPEVSATSAPSTSAPASVASSNGSRDQGSAGASKPSDEAAQKSATKAEGAAVAAQQVEITNTVDGSTSSSLKKVNGARGKIISTPDGTVVWRLGGGGNVERSVDSGTTWVRQSTGSLRGLLAGSAPNDVTCWLVGRKGTILVSTDGGGHWSEIASPIGGDIVRVTAADAVHAVIWGPNGTGFATADGGKTWSAGK